MPDRDEDAIAGQVGQSAGAQIAQAHTRDGRRFALAEDLLDYAIPYDADLRIAEQPLLQDLLGPQRIAAMN